MWVPLFLEGGGGDAKSRGSRTGGHNSSRVRKGWQHLRPQPRRKMGKTRRLQKRTVRRDCSRTATAAWAAVSGGDSPPSHAPSVPAGSGPPPSGTTRVATGASQNIPGFLEQNSTAWSEGRQQEGRDNAGTWRVSRDTTPRPLPQGAAAQQAFRQQGTRPSPWGQKCKPPSSQSPESSYRAP